MSLATFLNEYLPLRVAAKATYATWRRDNPAEATKWDVYLAALMAGQSPVAPVLRTAYGRALVVAVKMATEGDGWGSAPWGS